MSVSGEAMLADLRSHGLRLSIGVDHRLLVAPRGAVTPELDERIRAGKSALLDALEAERRNHADLVRRIREMAARWSYSDEDLAEALAAAEGDPAAWLDLCEADEEAASLAARVGRRYAQ